MTKKKVEKKVDDTKVDDKKVNVVDNKSENISNEKKHVDKKIEEKNKNEKIIETNENKIEKEEKKDKSSKQKQAKEGEISSAEIRIGKILKAHKHENADNLFVEEIDLGEKEPRTICSGLVKHGFQAIDLIDKYVLVFCNLKPKDAVGIKSNGMVLCATNTDGKVELIKIPLDAKIGERVIFEGYECEFEKQLNSKKLPKILKDLKTDKDGIVCFKDGKAKISSGLCYSSFTNSNVS